MLLELGLEVGDLGLERLDLGQQALHDRAHRGGRGSPLRRIDPERRHLVAHSASMKQQRHLVKRYERSRPNR